jgi:hypothetical protein
VQDENGSKTQVARQKKRERRAHLLMRYADGFAGTTDTVREHQRIARKHNSVWIGKLGTMTLSQGRIERLRNQIRANEPTYLYLAKNLGKDLIVHAGRLLEVQRDYPSSSSNLIPSYYPDDRTYSLWVRVSSLRRANMLDFAGVLIESSGNAAFQTLRQSQASLFTVVIDKSRQEEARRSPPDFAAVRRMRGRGRRPDGEVENLGDADRMDLEELEDHESDDDWGV